VAALLRNGRPLSIGIGARFESESLRAFGRNMQIGHEAASQRGLWHMSITQSRGMFCATEAIRAGAEIAHADAQRTRMVEPSVADREGRNRGGLEVAEWVYKPGCIEPVGLNSARLMLMRPGTPPTFRDGSLLRVPRCARVVPLQSTFHLPPPSFPDGLRLHRFGFLARGRC